MYLYLGMDIEIHTYEALESYIQAQLKKGKAYGADTFYQAALDAKQAIAEAGDYAHKMAAVARYGAVIKRWHHMLIVHITHIALKHATVSRTNVRHWQKTVFGKSMDSKELRLYSDSSRAHGDKVPGLPTDDPASLEAARIYARHQHLLKAKASPAKFAETLQN